MERINVPQRFMDIISNEFAYDPVKLPREQDPTGSLYNRKTLETIWETRQQAQNPFTRQWFDIKSVIPQIELRNEMERFIKLHNFPAELEVIAEYAMILDEGQMKRYLEACNSVSEILTAEKQWMTMEKKINLLRISCEFHNENKETFRSLHGYRYLEKLIWEIYLHLSDSDAAEEGDTEEGISNVCKEIVRVIDVIGLRSSDIVGENAMEFHVIIGLIPILQHVFFATQGYMKIDTVVLRVVCVIFDAMAADTYQVLGDTIYSCYLQRAGVATALIKLIEPNARDISSEDLNNGFAILRRAWIKDHDLLLHLFGHHSDVLVNAVNLCIAREIDRWDAHGASEGQVHEAEQQARHNCEALEKGLSLIKDILIDEGPLAHNLRVLDILEYIVGMFNRLVFFASPKLPVHGQKGRKSTEEVRLRIAQLGLDISAVAMFKRGGPQFDVAVLHKFLSS